MRLRGRNSLSISLLFSCKVFLASPRPTYLGNKSSSRIAGSADQTMKPPFGGGARPAGRKMNRGTVPFPTSSRACHDTA